MIKIFNDNFNFEYKISKASSKDIYFKHLHREWELYYLINGNTSFFIDGVNYKVKAGDLVLIKPTMFHFCTPDNSKSYERLTIAFNESIIPNVVIERIKKTFDHYNLRNSSPIKQLLQFLIANVSESNYEESILVIQYTLKLILIQLASNQEALNNTNSANAEHENEKLLKNVLNYIDNNIYDMTKLEEISKNVYISNSWLSHLFKKNLNISPKQYINHKKIFIAQNLILSGENPMMVYTKLGFINYSTFFRLYKKITKKSPKEDYLKGKKG